MKWLSRELITGPHMALVLSEEDYTKVMDDMGAPMSARGPWIGGTGTDARVHILENNKGHVACIVALNVPSGASGIEIAGILVHEAVHIFQGWCENTGEKNPSSEFEAYSIQSIAQTLMESYAEQTAGGRK